MTMLSCEPSVGLTTTVLASPQQVSCNVAAEAVLLSMRNGEYYGLNEVAACIWKHIQEPRKVIDLRDMLVAEYDDVDASECEDAIVAFLTEMIALHLVELA